MKASGRRRLRSNARLLGAEPFAFVWTIEIERRRRKEYRGPLINHSVASQGEMWTMLMQMIPSADAIGQTECDVSSAIGARTFVTPVAFTQAATLSRASGSGSEGWKTRAGSFPSALGRSGRRERMIVSGGLGECALARGGQKHFWPEEQRPSEWLSAGLHIQAIDVSHRCADRGHATGHTSQF